MKLSVEVAKAISGCNFRDDAITRTLETIELYEQRTTRQVRNLRIKNLLLFGALVGMTYNWMASEVKVLDLKKTESDRQKQSFDAE